MPLPCLAVFSGLPGTGKTTIARALAARIGAVFLRIDTIEQAMRGAGEPDVGPAGYAVANALAEANLRLGHTVIADCVNPVRASRQGWQAVATRAPARLVDIHLVCSDPAEHRRRVERRTPDIAGHVLPSWDDVMRRTFEPWDDGLAVLDTATMPEEAAVAWCEATLAAGLCLR